jgi:hypothetical protein
MTWVLNMTMRNSVIIPGVGFGSIKFGMSVDEVGHILGVPDEIKNPDEGGDITLDYERIGINILSFDKGDGFRLSAIEAAKNSDATLWGEKIFDLPFDQLEVLCIANGYELKFEDNVTYLDNKENVEVREVNYSIDQIGILFFFDGYMQLKEVNFGVLFDDSDEIIWPE